MIKYIKLPSLFIILLFFPISFYFNIFSINYNSENNFPIEYIEVDVYPEEDYSRWYVFVEIYLKEDAAPYIDIDWNEINRNGNTFYVNILTKPKEIVRKPPVVNRVNVYDLGAIEDGNYTFILYINGEKYPEATKEFTIENKEITLFYDAGPWIEWNGKEWVARVGLSSNMIPNGIHWGNVIKTKDGFMINIIVDEWLGTPSTHFILHEEHNYSLGILPEGWYWFYVYVNGRLDTFVPFEVSRILMTFTTIWSTATDIFTFIETYEYSHTTIVYTHTITDIGRKGQIITTYITIKVKENPEIETSQISTKTIQTSIKENPKGEFEIEKYTIPISLFIIVIMITISLYYTLFKRREI
ncbi:MAG: hypothetical protein QXY18_04630 [Nitrososphaerota archaeon]